MDVLIRRVNLAESTLPAVAIGGVFIYDAVGPQPLAAGAAALAVIVGVQRVLWLGRVRAIEQSELLEVRPAGAKGMGVFVAQGKLTKGEIVGEYRGKRLRYKQMVEFLGGNDADGDVETLWGEYMIKVHSDLYIDASDPACSNFARFINHSPNPNLEPQCNAWHEIHFIALRDIVEGEELSWNYGDAYWEGRDCVIEP